MPKVRIVNDGRPGWATKVTDAATGEDIPNVTQVDIRIDVREEVRAVLTTYAPAVDIIADAEIRQVCPCCGQPVEKSTEDNSTQPLQGA